MKPFSMTKTSAGDFEFYDVKASEVGDYRILKVAESISREKTANIVFMIRGGASYVSSNPNVPKAMCLEGETSDHLPDFKEGETFTISALTNDTEFFCINRKGHGDFKYTKVDIKENEEFTTPKGSCMLFGSGVSNLGTAPFICAAVDNNITCIAKTSMFGLLLEKL